MTPEQLIADYLTGPRLLREAVSGMTQEQLRARPIAGKWSTLEVVCHVADAEGVYSERFKRVIAEHEPALADMDPDLWMPRIAIAERDVVEEVQLVDLIRRHTARILKTLSPMDFQRVGHHSSAGPLTLQALLQRIVGHIPHHIKFIEEKRKLVC